jgi:hypothetical protein
LINVSTRTTLNGSADALAQPPPQKRITLKLGFVKRKSKTLESSTRPWIDQYTREAVDSRGATADTVETSDAVDK